MPVHHPFTAPVSADMPKLYGDDSDVATITGQHYDLVCNGIEVLTLTNMLHPVCFYRYP